MYKIQGHTIYNHGHGQGQGYCLPTELYKGLKFIYSEKATKFCEIFPLLLTVCTLISLINVELGINVEGVQKLPNH